MLPNREDTGRVRRPLFLRESVRPISAPELTKNGVDGGELSLANFARNVGDDAVSLNLEHGLLEQCDALPADFFVSIYM